MAKKILLSFLLLFSIVIFSQKKSIDNLTAQPNSFSESTVISFDSNHEQGVYLIIKNILGKTVFRKGYYTSVGKRTIHFERKDLKPGIYIYAIQSNNEVVSKRFIIKE
ncbi:MAG: T9SS type A sorting domain-containing protein [Tenacibaculum sp.]|nr:T9SS type A sorting domain-containing protein [Tenacibaculum sp.]